MVLSTKLKLWLALGVGALILALSILLFWLTTVPGEMFLAKRLISIFSKTLKQPVAFDKLETNLFSRIEIEGFRIVSPNSPSKKVLEFSSIRIKYNIIKSLISGLEIDSVRIIGLNIDVDRDSSNYFTLNLLNTSESTDSVESKQKKFNLSINYFDLHQSKVLFNDSKLDLGGSLNGLTSKIRINNLSLIEFEAKSEHFEISLNDAAIPAGEFFVAGTWRAPELQIDSLSLISSMLVLDAFGKISFASPSPEVTAKCRIDFSILNVVDALQSRGVVSLPRIDAILGIDLSMTSDFATPNIVLNVATGDLTWLQLSVGDLSISSVGFDSVGFFYWNTRLEASDLLVEDDSIESLQLSALISFPDSLISVADIKLELPDFVLHGNSNFVNEGMSGSLNAVGSVNNVANITGLFTTPSIGEIEGSIDIEGVIEGKFTSLNYNVKGVLPVIHFRRLNATGLKVDAEYVNHRVTISQLDGEFAKGRISIIGDFETTTMLHHLTLDVNSVDLFYLWSSLYESESLYEGFFSTRLKSSGVLSDPKTWVVKADLELDTLEFSGNDIPSLSAKFTVDSSKANFTLTQNENRVNAVAEIVRDSLSGYFMLQLAEVEPLAGLLGLSEVNGKLEINGIIDGTLADPVVNVSLVGSKLHYRNFPIDSLVSHLSYAGGNLFVADAFVGGELAPIDTTHSPFDIESLSGEFNYSANLNGYIYDPVINLTVNTIDLKFNQIAFQSGRIVLKVKDRQIVLEELVILDDSLTINSNGIYSLDSTFGNLDISISEMLPDSNHHSSPDGQMELSYRKLKQDHKIHLAATSIPLGKFLKVIGFGYIEGDVDMLVNGGFKKSIYIDKFELKGIDLVMAGTQLDSLTIKGMSTRSELIVWELHGYQDAGSFQSAGSINRSKVVSQSGSLSLKNSVNATVSGSQIDLAIVQPFLPDGVKVDGRADLNLVLTGKLEHPNALGFLRINGGNLHTELNPTFLDSIFADVSLTDTLITINSFQGLYNGLSFSTDGVIRFKNFKKFYISANLSIARKEAVHLRAFIGDNAVDINLVMDRFDLHLIEPLVPGIDALGGIASSDISITGTMKKPEIRGNIQLGKMYLSPNALRDSILNCSLSVVFDQRMINVVNFYGEFGEGKILGSGKYVYSGGSTDSTFKLHIADSRLLDSKDFLLTLKKVDVTVREEGQYILIDGDIVLGESRFRTRFSPAKIIALLSKKEGIAKESSPIFAKIKLDLKLHDSEDMWIDNNLARLNFRSDLAVVGNPLNPVVSGRISVIEGYVLYLDRKFNVNQGSLDFYNPVRINPFITLEATTEVKSFKSREETPHTITLIINGELDQAAVSLTSIPPEDVPDIMSLLTLGITRRDLTGTDGKKGDVDFQEAVRERLELITSRRISGYVASNVEDLLDLESFTIENNLFQFDKNWGPQLVASKKLSSRTELTYTTTIGRMNEQGIKLGYKLTDRWMLEGQTDQVGRSGIDLKYKMKLP